MDRYEDISDCEVDHSFFDSDFEEEVKKDRATTGIDKMENSGHAQIKHSVTDDCHLKQEAKVMEDNSTEEQKQSKRAESQKEHTLGSGAHNSNNALSLLASLNLEDPVDRITAQNEQALHENIPVHIPLRKKECEENYYTDGEDSSDDSRNQRVRHKFSKQPNVAKVNRNVSSSSSSSPSSSSDTDYSDTGSDGCLSDSSCSSEKKNITSPLISSEKQSSQGIKSEIKSKLGDHTEESEDTVTDVTPLSTPDISPIQSFEVAASNDNKLKVKRQQNVSQELYEPEVDHKCLQKVLHEAMDLNNLLKAFLQLEKKDQQELALNQSSLGSRKNYSFTNEEVQQIDRENQRLLKELTKHSAKPRNKSASVKKPSGSAPKMYHSAVNRQREQQRIDRENLAFLKRLEAVKPTAGMKRSEQLTDYQRQMGYFRTAGTPRRGKSALNHHSPSRGTSRTSSHSASSTINRRSENPVFGNGALQQLNPSNIHGAWL
ncbi:LOW QUALITY PROTEIN: cilia- and flagella-associated protein 97 [Vipera latastei]